MVSKYAREIGDKLSAFFSNTKLKQIQPKASNLNNKIYPIEQNEESKNVDPFK